MSAAETRAYAAGRLASLDSRVAEQARRLAGVDQPQLRLGLPRSASETSLDRKSPRLSPQRTPPQQRPAPVPVPVPAKAPPGPVADAPVPPRRTAKQRLSALAPKSPRPRPLSAIAERPGTSKSRASSTRSKRSIFSTREKPPPLPKFDEEGTTTGAGASGAGVTALAEYARSGASKSMGALSAMSGVSTGRGSDAPPPVPPKLRSALKSKPLPRAPTATEKLRLVLRRGKKPQQTRPESMVSVSSGPAGARGSVVSLGRGGGGFGYLHGDESRSTLRVIAVQEGLEKPFEVWLRALPYIEGGAFFDESLFFGVRCEGRVGEWQHGPDGHEGDFS
ncbi:hypothetical protein EJ06DRAFT_93265 [Trichodelitschia bisporula]|uniref:Uncharacterized protein n=1 Tax=Trichodelitschia bisporula TaxID=703511 RepID=A0A6G1HS30_9PEZI|nr:hypothetical protein EJ06DRAFT_93265 [Trichodelitschia bisporula]